jgi:predicted amidohydrolase YtcJ
MAFGLKADLVLKNGRIFKGLAEGQAQALAVWGGRVLATGSDDEIASLIGPATKGIDLRGRLATPGLYDAHMHLLPYGLNLKQVDIRPAVAPTLEKLLGEIAAQVARVKPGTWIVARGYDHYALDVRRHPHRDELDHVAPDNPVYLVRACGHVWIANSRALDMAGYTPGTPVPQGGAIEQHAGRLTGFLAETGRDRLKAILPDPSDEALVAGIEDAGKACLAFGITSVMDAGVGMRAGWREIVAYRTAQRTGRLPVRTNQCLLGGPGGIVEQAAAEGLITGVGDEMLKVGPVKIFTDGSAGGRTAAMFEPYLGQPDNRGLLLLRDNEMRDLTMDYHAKGYQLAVHAIGDAAIEQTLDAFEAALTAMPDPDRRHRVEHAGYATPEQTRRMVRLRVEPVPQPIFIHDFGDLYVDVLGPERANPSYPLRTWIDLGLHPAASSDAPVCEIDPFPNFYTMLTRATRAGTVMAPDQKVTIAQAIAAFTHFGAVVNKAERHRGKLLPGQAADIAVFSRDLLNATPEEIRDATRVDLTILDGAVVHDATGESH